MLEDSLQLILEDAREHMEKTLEHLRHELSTIRAGRATPAMLETVRVEYYGTHTPLNQMASVSAPQPDLLVVQPWDRSALGEIEKAIMAANLGLNPSNDGSVIRIPVPPPSEERRRDLAKSARLRGEEARVAIRNIRRHAKDHIKATQKEENLPEDMRFEAEEELQKLTDAYIEKVDKLLEHKEAEIMEV
ncbi:MAG: ribosome recycling factor [Bacteroidetes bacterium]|nr:MAG: ribosome recycling factor [Bacteroidota bacterium]GIV58771.1 MAG: ribosome-recycling factor [Rhodothermaceae bacterium]